MVMKLWTINELMALERMYTKGVPIDDIAKKLGRTKATIYTTARTNGYKRPSKIYEFYRNDKRIAKGTVKEIAKKLSVKEQTVRQYYSMQGKGYYKNIKIKEIQHA